MKKTFKALIGLVALVLVLPKAMAITTDGDLADWGVTFDELRDGLNDSSIPGENGNVSAWLPNPGVRFVIEDNVDPKLGYADAYATGVHIKGIGSSYSDYYEPLIDGQPQPLGREKYDMEAMYVSEDEDFIYVAIVYSGKPDDIGDLALNLDGNKSTGDYGYEFGVRLYYPSNHPMRGTMVGNLALYEIYDTSSPGSWKKATHDDASPARMKIHSLGDPVGYAPGFWRDSGIMDFGKTNYIIELAIPKVFVGMENKNLPEQPLPKKIHLTEYCGNDDIDIPIPEFGLLAIPIGLLFGMIYVVRRK